MNASQFLVLRTAMTVAATPAFCCGAGFLLDPVVTYTNGMRLASTTAERSHNAYWRCDPGHIGYCDGRYYTPCRNDARGLGARDWGRFAPPCTPRGAVSGMSEHAVDGMETGDSESIGVIAVDPSRALAAPGRGVAPTAPPVGAPASGGVWLDAIQSLGRQAVPSGG